MSSEVPSVSSTPSVKPSSDGDTTYEDAFEQFIKDLMSKESANNQLLPFHPDPGK